MALTCCGFSLESRGLGAEQQAKVQAFKRLLQQSLAWDDRCFDEHDCARFLKARGFDLQAAKQMWDSMLAWRRENRVDTIHDWFVFHERAEYDRVFPTGLHKTDKEGHPVLIQQLGRVNIGALYKVTTDERIRLAHIAENEHLRRVVFPACSRTARRPIDQLFTIIDLEGVAFTSMMRTTSLLKMFMAMDSNNYPETLAHMAIINAPGWFSTSWGAVKSVLSGETVRKIEILGKDYQAALLRHIPRENLLVEYGGLSRGRVTDNEGPWHRVEELLPEPPAPPPLEPLLPPPQPLLPPLPVGVMAAAAEAEDNGDLSSSGGGGGGGGGDQRTPRDVITRRSPSPVRPGAKPAAAAGAPGAGGHPAPAVSPPLAKRPHHEGVQLQPQPGAGCGGSPAPSVSDSDSAQSMAAPLMSNFLPASESPSPQQHRQQQEQQPQLSGGGVSSFTAAAASAGTPQLAMQRRSSGGGAGALVAGFVATLQAAVVGHAGTHHHQAPPQRSQQQHHASAAADGGVLRPPAGVHPTPGPQTPSQHQFQTQLLIGRGPSGSTAAGPAQLLLSSPREDGTGPGTLLSAVSATYSPPSLMSPLSPIEHHALADTATSARRTDGGGSGGGSGASTAGAVPRLLGSAVGAAPRRSGGVIGGVSGGGNVATFVSLPAMAGLAGAGSFTASGGAVSASFASAIMASGEVLSPAAALAASTVGQLSGQQPSLARSSLTSQQQQQYQPQLQTTSQGLSQSQNDMDDAESVRMSVMSQRSFYSALSHLDQSSSSGVMSPSPNDGSESARRMTTQRELHAAAIASALAATAERRAAATAAAGSAPAAGANTGSCGGAGLLKVSASGAASTAPTIGIPSAGALSGVSYIVPPAAQQAFGSYLDQPPPYGALRAEDGSSSLTAGEGLRRIPDGRDDDNGQGGGHEATRGSAAASSAALAGASGHRARCAAQTVDAVAIHVSSDSNGGGNGGGMSRSPSAAAMEECTLGAGAVRWARGWFFRRRNYGRLVESDGATDGASGNGVGQGSDGGRQAAALGRFRGGGGVGQYASTQDGPFGTSPSKVMPKGPLAGHHSRGDSWDWDQPSPYDIDQTYGRVGGGIGGGSGSSGILLRDASFSRSGERRRLLRSESPGRRRGLGDYCGCLPCCTIM